MPVAITENEAVSPSYTELSAGCLLMPGAASVTVKIAFTLATEPTLLVTTTENSVLLSVVVVAGVL